MNATVSPSRQIVQTVRGMPASDGAGVKLNRVIGQPALDMLDPFLMLDEFRSDQPGDYLAGFPDHPHRGFETVTYMLAGNMRHGDNQGNSGRLRAGSVQWMTAGRGIVHSEMPEQEDGLMWGFQLWVNLPARDKMTAPRYQDIAPEQVPLLQPADGVELRLLTGRIGDVSGPVADVATDPFYVDVRLQAGAQWVADLPGTHNAFVYVYDGDATVGEGAQARTLPRGQLGVLSRGAQVRLAAPTGGRLILVAGRPLNEPVAKYGPFVMNTQEQIMTAIRDYQAGRFV
ncbi:MAG: quercetin 2,3-dioxygenase [Lysobacterales bacterium 69-70]|nr:pirin family protein [Xanthomonadaceae bacterium]ODU32665.1 MAG: quercetin 2,3-dioxygenase [Xanthomonadaceae bacterium SCN 69-320]ODV19176.1 MAG: quercetin 2,3-dioxygenase [Xanthomonadaceae bacterium SCN 69-25]OJY99657.1 MAG: quercetin 2,3-dioxygenase [Xanthomonadales bacterium 69-70]